MSRTFVRLMVGVSLLATRSGIVTSQAGGATPVTAPLVQSANLVYQGAFRLPPGKFGPSTFEYGGTALAFNPARRSLFVVGHDQGQLVAEISIPEVRTGPSVAFLATASVLQPFADVTEGARSTVNRGDAVKIGGLLPYRGHLYLTAYGYYDAPGAQVVSHFVSGLDLSVHGDVGGPYQVGPSGFCGRPACAGFVDGYFGAVPPEWQAVLGGPVLNGQCCVPIISRTSYGPSLFAIDPTQLGVTKPLPATPLVYYPSSNPLAPWDSTNAYFNGSTEVKGVVFPQGTRSVLFFGRHGLGRYCYGDGAGEPAPAGQPTPDGYCYDPTSMYKGTHAYPYAYYVWAYDAVDLMAVKTGLKKPWAVKPYAAWKLEFPYETLKVDLNGAAYDPETARIFLSQGFAEGDLPVIHVFKVQVP